MNETDGGAQSLSLPTSVEIVPTPTGAGLVRGEADPWEAALATWLQGKTANTRRSYLTALRDFFACTGGHPSQATALDVARWKETLRARGCAAATIAHRVSVVSSFYTYLQRPRENGLPLVAYNPVDGVERGDVVVSPYERSRKLTVADFRRILAVIPDTPIGARDRALFLFYVLCARRRSEVANLRGGDLRLDGQKVVYRVRLKGGKVKWKELPPPVWEAIRRYLELTGRVLTDDTPVFTATVENGQYLRRFYGKGEADGGCNKPLTGEAIAQALKRYARRAGIDPAAVSVHSLRHLGAELFYQASGDVRQTQLFLDHAQLNTTQIYLEQLGGDEHRCWQAMLNRLEP